MKAVINTVVNIQGQDVTLNGRAIRMSSSDAHYIDIMRKVATSDEVKISLVVENTKLGVCYNGQDITEAIGWREAMQLNTTRS